MAEGQMPLTQLRPGAGRRRTTRIHVMTQMNAVGLVRSHGYVILTTSLQQRKVSAAMNTTIILQYSKYTYAEILVIYAGAALVHIL